MTLIGVRHDPLGDRFHAIDVGHGGTAVFLDDQTHAFSPLHSWRYAAGRGIDALSHVHEYYFLPDFSANMQAGTAWGLVFSTPANEKIPFPGSAERRPGARPDRKRAFLI
jgi:hypothetical protein